MKRNDLSCCGNCEHAADGKPITDRAECVDLYCIHAPNSVRSSCDEWKYDGLKTADRSINKE